MQNDRFQFQTVASTRQMVPGKKAKKKSKIKGDSTSKDRGKWRFQQTTWGELSNKTKKFDQLE